MTGPALLPNFHWPIVPSLAARVGDGPVGIICVCQQQLGDVMS